YWILRLRRYRLEQPCNHVRFPASGARRRGSLWRRRPRGSLVLRPPRRMMKSPSRASSTPVSALKMLFRIELLLRLIRLIRCRRNISQIYSSTTAPSRDTTRRRDRTTGLQHSATTAETAHTASPPTG